MPTQKDKQIRQDTSTDSLAILKKIYAGKGRFQGNYYFVSDSRAEDAGIAITLTAKDKDGTKATKEGKSMRAGISGVMFSKGIVTYEADTKRLCLAPRKGNASVSIIKRAIKNVLAKDYGLILLKKAIIGDTGSEEVDASEAEAIELSDMGISAEEEQNLLKEMEADEDLKALFNDAELQNNIASMNAALASTFLEDQAYFDELMVDEAVTEATDWWGDTEQDGWSPPPIVMPDEIVPTGADNRGSDFMEVPDKQLRYIKKLNKKFDKLNAKQLNELIHRIRNYHTQIGYKPAFTSELIDKADNKLASFQRIKALEKKGISYDQATEEYFRNLYKDAAKAQLRLSNLLDNVHSQIGADKCDAMAPPVHKIKGTDRARVKAGQNSAVAGESDFSTLGDLARGSLVFNKVKDIIPGIQKFIGLLPVGCVIPKFKNRFAVKKSGESHYRDIIMTMTLDNGHITEMQFHSKDVIEAKSDGTLVPEANRPKITEAITAIDKLVADGITTVPKDTIEIIANIKDQKWKLSGHDFYNITRWIDAIDGSQAVLTRCKNISGKLSSAANEMYDEAFNSATDGTSADALNTLQTLDVDTVRSWIPT
ncbi:MAG: hypothetical protein ACON4U_02885 [Myxococcota bacterium]